MKELGVQVLVVLGIIGITTLFSRYVPSTGAASKSGTGNVLKIFIVLTFCAGIGAAFVGKVLFAAIAIALALLGYIALCKIASDHRK
jgi:hypothetical protein